MFKKISLRENFVAKLWIVTLFFQGTRFKSAAAVPERRLRMFMDVCACGRLSLIPCSPSLRRDREEGLPRSETQRGAFCTWTMICSHARVYTCNQRYVPAPRCGNVVRRSRSGVFLCVFCVSVSETSIGKHLTITRRGKRASVTFKCKCDLLNWRTLVWRYSDSWIISYSVVR